MSENKTKPTDVSVDKFLSAVSEKRKLEARKLIALMQNISGSKPVMWGPSIIGFGSQHYKYDTGREGDMPQLAFSPRKSAITIYFDSFEHYGGELKRLGKFRHSVACLYINKLEDIDINVLEKMLKKCFSNSKAGLTPKTVESYVASIPDAAKENFDELRALVKNTIPQANEVISYGVIGYKIDDKRAKVFISAWKDHLGVYPIPKDRALQLELAPFIKGKGTLWFSLNEELPKGLIKKVVKELITN